MSESILNYRKHNFLFTVSIPFNSYWISLGYNISVITVLNGQLLFSWLVFSDIWLVTLQATSRLLNCHSILFRVCGLSVVTCIYEFDFLCQCLPLLILGCVSFFSFYICRWLLKNMIGFSFLYLLLIQFDLDYMMITIKPFSIACWENAGLYFQELDLAQQWFWMLVVAK